VDLRLNASNATMVSAVHQLILTMSISALFLTVPGDTPARRVLYDGEGPKQTPSKP
jgi:hypothetical protein